MCISVSMYAMAIKVNVLNETMTYCMLFGEQVYV